MDIEAKIDRWTEMLLEGRMKRTTVIRLILGEMARGVPLLVDENLTGRLADYLGGMNYTVDTVPAGVSDARIKSHYMDPKHYKVFITINGKDFDNLEDKKKYNYGLIWVKRGYESKVLAQEVKRKLMASQFHQVGNRYQTVRVNIDPPAQRRRGKRRVKP